MGASTNKGLNIPDLVLRARVVRGLKQAELADELGVTSASVSRWETGKMSPSPAILSRLYRMLVETHPVWTLEYIESSPVPRYVHHIDDLMLGILVSKGMCTVFDSTQKELLSNWLRYSGPIIPELYKQAQAHPDFENCHHIEAVFQHVEYESLWWHARGLIIDDVRSVLWEGSLLPTGPAPSIKVVTKDEMARLNPPMDGTDD